MRRLFPGFIGGSGAVGLLALRLVFGLAMVLHGYGKIQAPTSWMGPKAPVPGIFQAAAAASEFVGGLGLMVGLLTPVTSTFIAFTMAVAAVMAHYKSGHPFVASKPGEPSGEAATVYFAIALMFLLVGPGKLAIDAILFDKPKPSPKVVD